MKLAKVDCHKIAGKHKMCDNKFEKDRENHPALVKIIVAKHYVDPWYVKIYCNKNNDLKENVKLTKESPGRMSQITEKHEMCETVWPCGQAKDFQVSFFN